MSCRPYNGEAATSANGTMFAFPPPSRNVVDKVHAEAPKALSPSRRRTNPAAGRATAGPHRDDLSAIHAATGRAAARCSTGEQKAMLLSLVLAHSDSVARARGQRPVLLLDEVAAHLDPLRRGALYERLAGQGGQAWLTGTDDELFAGLRGRARFFRVLDATVMPR